MARTYDLLCGLALLRESRTDSLNDWQGIAVTCDRYQLLIDKSVVDEMLNVSEATRILDERPWLAGFMNYRGKLLPLIETKQLILPALPHGRLNERQVVILTEKYGPIGLLVDTVVGMRHFWSDDEHITIKDSPLNHLVKRQINYDDQSVEVLDLSKLMSAIKLNIALD